MYIWQHMSSMFFSIRDFVNRYTLVLFSSALLEIRRVLSDSDLLYVQDLQVQKLT